MGLEVLNRFLAEVRPKRRHRQRRKGDAKRDRKTAPSHVSFGYTPQQAYAAGFRWASVAPKGHVVTVHRTEAEGQRYLRETLRKSGCVVKPLEVML